MNGYVYAIQQSNAPGTPIKVGWSTTPKRRLADLQVGSPVRLTLLDAIAASREDERELHLLLRLGLDDVWLHGEWFRPTGLIGAWFRWGPRRRDAAGLEPLTGPERALLQEIQA